MESLLFNANEFIQLQLGLRGLYQLFTDHFIFLLSCSYHFSPNHLHNAWDSVPRLAFLILTLQFQATKSLLVLLDAKEFIGASIFYEFLGSKLGRRKLLIHKAFH